MSGAAVDKIIKARAKTHGNFQSVADVAQHIQDAMRRGPNWNLLSSAQRIALAEDAVKTARILCGDPNFVDHWNDKAGYAQLIADELAE